MVLAFKSGLMAPNTKANGKTIRPMDKENFAILMETSTKVNGSMTDHVAKAHTYMQMEPNLLVSGRTTSKTGLGLSHGSTVKFTKASTKMAQKLEKAF